MDIVCLDLEGTLTPEIWIEVAHATGIPELERTTRDEPDYSKLMSQRLDILRQHNLTLSHIQRVIAGIDPLPGAKEFLDALRERTQVAIVSDTFTQFAQPLMRKFGWPMIFCNELKVDDNDMITGWHMRQEHMKLSTVRGLQALGYDTIAAGDSHNDLEMIRASKAGFLFHAPAAIAQANPDVPSLNEYDELLEAIEADL